MRREEGVRREGKEENDWRVSEKHLPLQQHWSLRVLEEL